MTLACTLSWLVFLALLVVSCVFAYAFGWRAATKRHWRMLQRAGSKIGNINDWH